MVEYSKKSKLTSTEGFATLQSTSGSTMIEWFGNKVGFSDEIKIGTHSQLVTSNESTNFSSFLKLRKKYSYKI